MLWLSAVNGVHLYNALQMNASDIYPFIHQMAEASIFYLSCQPAQCLGVQCHTQGHFDTWWGVRLKLVTNCWTTPLPPEPLSPNLNRPYKKVAFHSICELKTKKGLKYVWDMSDDGRQQARSGSWSYSSGGKCEVKVTVKIRLTN